MTERFSFVVKARDGAARTGIITTPRGVVRALAVGHHRMGCRVTVATVFSESGTQPARGNAHPLLTALTGEAVQANKAIVGRNAFAHQAGIHQDGMLKDRRTYEIMRPEEVGVPQATLVLGKHSGRHAVLRRCEQLGLALERHEVETVYWAIMSIADREKVVSDRDLADVIGRIRGRRTGAGTPAAVSDFNGTPAEIGYGHGV